MPGRSLLEVVAGLTNTSGGGIRLSWPFSQTSRETIMSAMERSSLSPAHLRLCRENYDRRQSQLLNGPPPDPLLPAHYVQYINDLDPSKDVLDEEVHQVEDIEIVEEVEDAGDSEGSIARLNRYSGEHPLAGFALESTLEANRLPVPPENPDEVEEEIYEDYNWYHQEPPLPWINGGNRLPEHLEISADPYSNSSLLPDSSGCYRPEQRDADGKLIRDFWRLDKSVDWSVYRQGPLEEDDHDELYDPEALNQLWGLETNSGNRSQPNDDGYEADVGEDTTMDGQFASANAEPVSPLSTHDTEMSLIMAIRTNSSGTFIHRDSAERLALDEELGREGADKLINRTVRKFNRKHGTIFTRSDIGLNRPESPANRSEDEDRAPEAWNCPYIRRAPVPGMAFATANGPSFQNTPKRADYKSHRHHRTTVLSPKILSGLGAYVPGPQNVDRSGIPMAQPVRRRFTLDDSDDEGGKAVLCGLLPAGKVTKLKNKLHRH